MNTKTLALYLGCPVMAVTSKLGEHRRKLVGVYDEGEVQSAKLWFAGGISDWDIEDFKLLLRPLSSMTEEERKELWRLVFSQGHGKNFNDRFKDFRGQIRVIDETTYYNVPRLIMMQGVERLAIESDGTIWADCDLHTWRHNQHSVTVWLLSKGFDLFSLIEKGEALDSTSQPEGPKECESSPNGKHKFGEYIEGAYRCCFCGELGNEAKKDEVTLKPKWIESLELKVRLSKSAGLKQVSLDYDEIDRLLKIANPD